MWRKDLIIGAVTPSRRSGLGSETNPWSRLRCFETWTTAILRMCQLGIRDRNDGRATIPLSGSCNATSQDLKIARSQVRLGTCRYLSPLTKKISHLYGLGHHVSICRFCLPALIECCWSFMPSSQGGWKGVILSDLDTPNLSPYRSRSPHGTIILFIEGGEIHRHRLGLRFPNQEAYSCIPTRWLG